MSAEGAEGSARLTTNPLLWGAYLACSWTWCIGMFLPGLLLRDHGWLGFIVFAIPNVVGAAAMGWVLTSPEASKRFVEKHSGWVWWFGVVTIAYHVYWALWAGPMIRDALGLTDTYLFGAGAVVVAFAIVSGRIVRAGKAPALSAVLMLVSLGLLVAMLVTGAGDAATDALIEAPKSEYSAWFLGPLASLGFLLCPYLDGTFHHARENLPGKTSGRVGFTVGFGVLFAAMIVLTTRYAGWILGGGAWAVPEWLGAWLVVHLGCQWVFTVRVHLDRLHAIRGDSIGTMQISYGTALLAAGLGLGLARAGSHAAMSMGEVGYRSFLWFYGLVFPCAVLYRAVRAHSTGVPMQRWMMWAAIGVATPMFWMGFIERQLVWLIPGVVVAVVGAFVLKGTDRSDAHTMM